MKEFKKKLAVILAFCMVLTSTVPAFAATIQGETETEISAQTEDKVLLENDEYEEASPSNTKYEDNILTDEEDIEEVIIEENFEDVALIDDTEEVLPAEDEEAEFFAEVKVGNVIITAKAEAGVVPKGTILKAKKVVDKEVKEAIDEVVEEKREDEAQVVESLKFDIKLIKDDEEIEPDGLVSLSFALADAAANAEANIYHIIEDEETKELVEAEVLEVETVEEPEDEATLVLETEVPGFSYYVVEFTVGELQYVLEGDSSVKLSEILAELKIEGTVTEAVSGAPELFSVEKDATGDDWTVTALKAFSTEEWMKVTVDGKEYTIVVTDAITTVSAVLATVKGGFPTDPASSNWENAKGCKIYVSGDYIYAQNLSGETKQIAATSLRVEKDYSFADSYTDVHGLFHVSADKLVSVELVSSDSLKEEFFGVYEPKIIPYTVIFNQNGGTGSMGSQSMTYGVPAKLNQNTFTPPDGTEFAGWAEISTAQNPEYANGEVVINLADTQYAEVTLYAVWKKDSDYTVVHYLIDEASYGYGTITNNIDIWQPSGTDDPKGSTATAKDGYKFVGWKDAEDKLITETTDDVEVDGKTIRPRRTSTKDTYYTAFFEKLRTIAEILPEDFPATEADGWKNANGIKAYKTSKSLNIGGCSLPFDKGLTSSGDDYSCAYEFGGERITFVFKMSDGKLQSIEVIGGTPPKHDQLYGEYKPAPLTEAGITYSDFDFMDFELKDLAPNNTSYQATVSQIILTKNGTNSYKYSNGKWLLPDESEINVKDIDLTKVDHAYIDVLCTNGKAIFQFVTTVKANDTSLTLKSHDPLNAPGYYIDCVGEELHIYIDFKYAAVLPTLSIDTAKTEYEIGEVIKLTINVEGISGSTTVDITDGTNVWKLDTDSDGKAILSDATKTAAGTYTYTVTLPQFDGVSALIYITVKKPAPLTEAGITYSDFDFTDFKLKDLAPNNTSYQATVSQIILTKDKTNSYKYSNGRWSLPDGREINVNDIDLTKVDHAYIDVLCTNGKPIFANVNTVKANDTSLTLIDDDPLEAPGYCLDCTSTELHIYIDFKYVAVLPTLSIDTAKTEYEIGEVIKLTINVEGISGSTTVDITDGTNVWKLDTNSDGKAILSDATKTAAGTYTYTANISSFDISDSVTIKVEKPVSKIVTFIYRNGKENKTEEVRCNEKVSKPSDPKMEGYTFDVWCSDAECKIEYDFSTPVIDNLPLYARWKKDAGTEGNVRTEDKVVEIIVQTENPEERELIADIKKNTSGSVESANSLADAVKNKVKEEATKNGKDVILFIDTQLTGIKVEKEQAGETGKATITLTYDATPWMSAIGSDGKVEETRKIDNNDLNGNITLRLPVPASITEKYVNIVHESDGYPKKTYKNLEIVNQGTDNAYVEIKISHFSSFELTFSNEKSIDPVPYNGNSGSGSTSELFTGRPGNPVTNGKWTQNADGTWSYATSRKFTSTWGYIANPNDAGSAAWYYFDRNGNMLTGWQKLYWNGAYRWYYFSQTKDSNEGKCQLGGITPDGWTVDESGAWVESIPKK